MSSRPLHVRLAVPSQPHQRLFISVRRLPALCPWRSPCPVLTPNKGTAGDGSSRSGWIFRVQMPKRSAKKSQGKPSAEWRDVAEACEDPAVLAAAKEVEGFWTHGPIKGPQIEKARVRTRGTRKTKTNTDYEIDIRVEEVLYRAAVKGEGDPKVRCPDTGRVWVTQPCVVCGKDDDEESLLLCGTDEAEAEVPGCNRSHHTHCVGLKEVPEDDWFCDSCEDKRRATGGKGD